MSNGLVEGLLQLHDFTVASCVSKGGVAELGGYNREIIWIWIRCGRAKLDQCPHCFVYLYHPNYPQNSNASFILWRPIIPTMRYVYSQIAGYTLSTIINPFTTNRPRLWFGLATNLALGLEDAMVGKTQPSHSYYHSYPGRADSPTMFQGSRHSIYSHWGFFKP